MTQEIFHRSTLIFGTAKMQKLAQTRIIIFGLGGVGSWCAESLVRTGIQQLTIVDSDTVVPTNINRQLMATTQTVGQIKVLALKKRLLEINPNAQIQAIQKVYSKDNFQEFELDSYDFIIDAIDSLANKIHLIHTATKTRATFISSMGAALRIDPTRVKVDTFWQIRGCPLARRLRKMLRKNQRPAKDFLCVYSDEVLENQEFALSEDANKIMHPEVVNSDLTTHDWSDTKAIINGSLAHVTGIFGLTLAGLVLQELYNKQ